MCDVVLPQPPTDILTPPSPPVQERLKSLSNVDVSSDLFPVVDYSDVKTLKAMIQRHLKFTGSDVARRILLNWDKERLLFKKVFPADYRRALQEQEALAKAETAEKELMESYIAAKAAEASQPKVRSNHNKCIVLTRV